MDDEQIDPRLLDEGLEASNVENEPQPNENGRNQTILFDELIIRHHPTVRIAMGGSRPKQFEPLSNVKHSGPRNIPRKKGMKESEYLNLYYDEIIEQYVEQTNNKNSNQASPDWDEENELTLEECRRWFAADLYTDVVQRKGDLKGYWSKEPWGDSFIKSLFTRDRFLAIKRNLTWLDTSNISVQERRQRNADDGFWTVTSLIEKAREKFIFYYKPSSKLSVDEMTVFFKGRHRYRFYNPNKPAKWHFKIWSLCDSSNGFMFNWFPCGGKDDNVLRERLNDLASEYPVIRLRWEVSTEMTKWPLPMMHIIVYRDDGNQGFKGAFSKQRY